MSLISRDNIHCVVIPTICSKRGCKLLTSRIRVRKTCDFHLNKAADYRKNPEIRDKNKSYMRKYYNKKRDKWSQYEWNKKKLETVLKIQQMPHIKIMSISGNYELITLKLENLPLPLLEHNSPFVPPLLQTPPDNPRIRQHNLGTLFDTP